MNAHVFSFGSISHNGTEQNKGLNYGTEQIKMQIGEFLKPDSLRYCYRGSRDTKHSQLNCLLV